MAIIFLCPKKKKKPYRYYMDIDRVRERVREVYR